MKSEGSNVRSAARPVKVKVHMKLRDREENIQKEQLAERSRCKPSTMKVKVTLK